ncbi:MAG: 3'(2'),5'-bisphosphate nucleotidase CysQ [Clostridiales bacterium]|nr:3'(2'),5'-bisphosphate nucleotidase CysQ [Clostridiales bacterium]
MLSDKKRLLSVMIRAAEDAGHVIMKYYNGEFSIEKKEDGTPVTSADIAASGVILNILHAEYPDFAIMCEETDDDKESRLSNDYCFIVDPLDGTKSFVKHTGEFAVSIAVAEHHEVVAGVIFIPTSGELYYAFKGEGAYKTILSEDSVNPFEDKRIHVSDRCNGLIAVQSSSSGDKLAEQIIEENSFRIADVLRVSSCIKGCMIADGRADIHYRFAGYTKEWDTAGEEIICREAGAIVTDAAGGTLTANREDVRNLRGIRIINRSESALDSSYINI